MSKELKVGVLTVVAGALLYYGFNFLKGIDIFNPAQKYYAVYEKVEGLSVGNVVIVNGFGVGRVSKISIMQQRGNKILVELSVDKQLILGNSAKAILSSLDFLGSKGIIIEIGDINKPLLEGDTLISDISGGLENLIDQATPVANNLNATIRHINEILIGMKGSGEIIKSDLQQIDTLLIRINSVIATNEVVLNETLQTTHLLLLNINDKVTQLQGLIDKSDGLMDSLATLDLKKTLAETNQLLSNLNTSVTQFNESDGTIKKLLTTDSLHQNLNKLIIDIDSVLMHFHKHPKHYLSPFGKSAKKVAKEFSEKQEK